MPTRDAPAGLGHSPLGALSVVAMLTVLGAQVATGLVSVDDIAFAGPLVAFVSSTTTSLATAYHKDVGKLLLLALVVLHVGAIVFYQQVKKQRLVSAMLTGDHTIATPEQVTPSADHLAPRLMALGVLGGCVALVAGLVSLGG